MSTFKSLNPTNLSDVVVETKLATPDEIADAARRAKAAQKAWAKMPAPARGRVIANAGRLFENNKEALSKLVTREMGKVYREALGDVQEVIDTCDFFLGEGRRLYGQTVPSEMPNKNLFTFRMPVGTALIITAGNFPAAVPSGMRRFASGLELMEGAGPSGAASARAGRPSRCATGRPRPWR